MEALLLSKDLSFSKHKAAISAFGKEFIKTNKIPVHLHRYILDAFDARQAGDYGSIGSVNEEKAGELIGHTKEFIEVIEKHLKKEGYQL